MRKAVGIRPWLVAGAFLIAPLGVLAQTASQPDTLVVDLTTARRIGLASRPQRAVALAHVDVAQGRRRQAGAYPFNPQLQMKTPGLIRPGEFGAVEALFTQELEWAGQWGLRKRVADAGLSVAQEHAADAERIGVYEIDVAFYNAVATERQLTVAGEELDVTREWLDAAETQLREGSLSELETNLVRIEVGRAEAAFRRAQQTHDAACLALRLTLGLPYDQSLRLDEGTDEAPVAMMRMEVDSLVLLAMTIRPDLKAATGRIDQWVAEQRLASRLAIPNFRISAVADRPAAGDQLDWGIQLALPLPLWNRNGGLRDAARGEVTAAEAERDLLELRIRTQVRTAYAAFQSARDQLLVFRSNVLPSARANRTMLDAAFEAGRFNLPTLLIMQTQLFGAETEYWDIWLAERTANSSLRAVIGVMPEDGPN